MAGHPMSRVSEELIRCYRGSEYRVDAGDDTLVLHIDQYSADLAALLQARGVDCAVFVTAANPHSEVTSDQDNATAQARLAGELEAGGWSWLPALGIDPHGSHPGEDSMLVLGIDAAAGVALGRRYRQNAILSIAADAIPRLVMV